MSERLRRAYEKKQVAETKARMAAADEVAAEQRLMGELFKHNNPQFYPGYRMPRKAGEELTARGVRLER